MQPRGKQKHQAEHIAQRYNNNISAHRAILTMTGKSIAEIWDFPVCVCAAKFVTGKRGN